MDFWQKLKGKTRIWVTKGRIPGSLPWIKVGGHLPKRVPTGCQLPQPPKPPTKCQESYQLGAQLSETIGDIVIKDEQKHADLQRIKIQQKYNGTGKGHQTGNLGEDILMRQPPKAEGQLGNPRYYPEVPILTTNLGMSINGVEMSTVYTVDVKCAFEAGSHTVSLRTDDIGYDNHLFADTVTLCKLAETDTDKDRKKK